MVKNGKKQGAPVNRWVGAFIVPMSLWFMVDISPGNDNDIPSINTLVGWPSPMLIDVLSFLINMDWRWIQRYLVGGFNPSEKYARQLGSLFPIYGKIKNVPNHQPVILYIYIYIHRLINLDQPASEHTILFLSQMVRVFTCTQLGVTLQGGNGDYS